MYLDKKKNIIESIGYERLSKIEPDKIDVLSQINDIELKLQQLKNANNNENHKQDLNLYYNYTYRHGLIHGIILF
mgnify:CR=1 FL=1